LQEFFKEEFPTLFAYFYAVCVLGTIIISLSSPIDKAMCYFRSVGLLFSIMTIGSLVAIAVVMADETMMCVEKHWQVTAKGGKWVPTGGPKHLSKMVLAGTVMLTVYVLPMLLRPIDFVYNFKGYFIGLITYLFLLPMFVNIMQIYGFCNLHDLSWGNRPTAAAGT